MQPIPHPDWKTWILPLMEIPLDVRKHPLFQTMIELFYRYDSLAALCSPVREIEQEILDDLNQAMREELISRAEFDSLYWEEMESILGSMPPDMHEGWHQQWRCLASATSMAAELGIKAS